MTSQWTGGTQTTGYAYNQAGELAGISTSAGSDTLSWDANGKLSSVTSGSAAVASYVYDASGSLLVRTDGSTSTLYLPDEEITSTNGTLSGVRYYSLGGVTVAARTSAGSVSYLAGDQQGTSTVSIDSVSLNVTRRYFDPYGNPVGVPPGSWPGTRGFVGGSADTVTGFTNLGAREYNPGTSAFISPDPLQSPYNPQDLNPYAYAGDDPATNSDPSGLMFMTDGGGGGYYPPVYTPPASPYSYGRTSPGGYYWGPTNTVHTALFMAPPATAPRTARASTPHAPSSPGSYSPTECMRFGLTCSGFSQYEAYQRAHPFRGGGGWGWLGDAWNWAVSEYKHNSVFRFAVNTLAVAGATIVIGAACAATAGGACIAIGVGSFTIDGAVVANGAVAGAGTSMLAYGATTRRRTVGGYVAAGLVGAATAAVPAASNSLAASWADGLTLGRSEKVMLNEPFFGSAAFWGKAGWLWLGIQTGKW